MKSYHFDLGDSNAGPVGYCARVCAESKEEAVKKLRAALNEVDRSCDIHHGLFGGIDYITVYFNPDKISVEDIDEDWEEV